MKTICILSYQRTGSSWLCDILSGENSIGIQEIFSKDPMLFSYTLSLVLNKIYKVKPSIVNAFNKIYNINNFFVNTSNYNQIKKNILNNKPYSIDLLKDIQNISYNNNYNLVFKIFPEHLDSVSLDQILDISDYILINYRNNLLDSFISEKKSLLSQRWTSLQVERQYLEKIEWNEKEYTSYVDKVIFSIDYFLKNTKEHVLISYEKIHECQNKIDYINMTIQNFYKDFDWKFKDKSILEKENYITKIEDNFLNKEDFLRSYRYIRKKIYE